MTASTGSAYPSSVEDLMPQVRELMLELGKVPARNEIMRAFKIGAPKANKIIAALAESETPEERGTEVESGMQGQADHGPVRPLRSVPALAPETILLASADPDVPTVDETLPASGEALVTPVVDPGPVQSLPVPDVADVPPLLVVQAESTTVRRVRRWPIVMLALPAFVAIWGGWVGLGRMTGFGPIQLLPGIWDELVINSAITLPIGVEAYAAFAMSVWLSGQAQPIRTRRFAMWSALGSLALGMAGQVAYHLMSSAGVTVAPWLITTFVACLPVVVLGCGAALLHLLHEEGER
jgi:hypothetical protein